MPTRKPKLGFVGLGWIGRHRLRAIAESGAAEVAWLCDPDADALAQAQALAPDAAVAGTIGELLERDLDGVVIATPSAQHAQQTIAALQRGVAVFCQKPLGRHAAEVSRVLAAAEDSDRLVGVDLSYRCSEAAQRLRRAVQEGEVGSVYAARLTFHNAYGPDKPWFYDPRQAGGGALIDLGTHLIDLLLWSLGFPAVISVSSQLFVRGKPLAGSDGVEDFAAAQLSLATGASVQLACSWQLHEGADCVTEAALYGTEGGVRLQNRAGSFHDLDVHALHEARRRPLCAPSDAWGGRMAVQWAAQLARDRSFDPRAREVMHVASVIDRIYAAAGRPRRVEGSCAY